MTQLKDYKHVVPMTNDTTFTGAIPPGYELEKIIFVEINNDWKLTITSTVAQGAVMAIPYNVIDSPMEA